MWITAADAINRYDGSHVKVFNLNKYFKNCPNLQQGYGFIEDDNANIYIGSDKGLYKYSHLTDKFTLQKIFTAPDEITMPLAFKNNKVWCFNRYYQLATYNVKTKEIKIEASISLDTITGIHVYQNMENLFYYRFPSMDNKGNIWMVGKHKVACYTTTTKTVNYPILAKPIDKVNIFFCAAFDTLNNCLNIGTNKGILRFYPTSNSTQLIEQVEKNKLSVINQIACGNNVIAINTNESVNGIAIIDTTGKKAQWLKLQNNQSTRTLNQFSFDKSGRLWTMDDAKGQKIFSFKEKFFNKIPADNTILPLREGSSVASICELPNKDMLFQSYWALNTKNKSLYLTTKNNNGLEFHFSFTDTVRKGVWYYEASSLGSKINKKPTFSFKGKDNNEVNYFDVFFNTPTTQLQDMVCLPNGQILLSNTTGLFWFNPKLSKITIANSIVNAFKINVLSNNRVAVSYLNKDLLLYQINKNEILKDVQHILPGVQSFYIQENTITKQYWVGSNNGIYLLDESFKTIKRFDANNGLAGTYIYGLLLDDDGNAWCSHQHGLSSINAKNYTIINYDKSDGIQDWDFNNRAFYKATDGTLYFGGINGVNYFKPPLQKNNYYKAEVYIDDILVNNATYLPDTNANQLQKITTNYKNNNISIKAVINDLENATYKKIIYRLKEQGLMWNFTSNNAILNFTSLQPGSYTLQIGVFDKFSNKEIIQKTIIIEIASPFYQKTWFWLLIGILSSGLFFWLLNRIKLNKRKTIFQQQQALQSQRQKITADLHDDIGSSLSCLQVNSSVANILIDKDVVKAKEILNKIETQSKNIAENIGDFIWSMKPGKEEFIALSGRIKNFAADILGSTNIEYEITIDKEIDTLITDVTMRKHILFIAKEAINNAVKYSQASTLKLQLVKKNRITILFSVKDNGVGFTTDCITGNGVTNMQKRVEELNGKFSIVSNNNGTEVKFEMPIG